MKTIASNDFYPDEDLYLPGRRGASSQPDATLRDLRSARPEDRPDASGPEIAFDPDTRDRITNTSRYPFSAICALSIVNKKDKRCQEPLIDTE
jgi:V8-like Glu-specific endopeptidase